MYYVEKSWPVECAGEHALERGRPGAHHPGAGVPLQPEHHLAEDTHFYANTPRIDFETKADWKEHQHLLKAEFPVDIHSDEAHL